MAIMTTYLPRSDEWDMVSVHCPVNINDVTQYNDDGVETQIIIITVDGPSIYGYGEVSYYCYNDSAYNYLCNSENIGSSCGDSYCTQLWNEFTYNIPPVLLPSRGYWIRTNPSGPGYFTYDCPDIGDSVPYIFPSLWVRGDGDGTHIPPWRVNYISYTFPIPLSMNSLFPGSWYDSDPDTGEASPGVLTNQDVIYTDFWNYTAGGEIVENKPSSYYDGAEWVPNIILQPGRGYVLKTRLNGYVKWTLN